MRRRTLGIAENFRRMIAMLAWRTWKVLPRQHQIWIDVDDLIEDGMFVAFEVVYGKWDKKTRSRLPSCLNEDKASLCTLVYHAVHNFLNNEYIKKLGSEQRFASLESAGIISYAEKYERSRTPDGKKKPDAPKGNTSAGILSLDAPRFPRGWLASKEGFLEPPQLSTSEDTIYNNVLTGCFVVPVLGKIYQEASSTLQEEMVVWFCKKKEKLHLESRRFRRAAKEFQMISREYDLTRWDCVHMFQSPRCMNMLSHELTCIPYDLNHPTPFLDKEL